MPELVLLADAAKQQVLAYRQLAKDGVLLRHVTECRAARGARLALFHGVRPSNRMVPPSD